MARRATRLFTRSRKEDAARQESGATLHWRRGQGREACAEAEERDSKFDEDSGCVGQSFRYNLGQCHDGSKEGPGQYSFAGGVRAGAEHGESQPTVEGEGSRDCEGEVSKLQTDKKVARALSKHVITPRRCFTLSRRKKRMIDYQLRVDGEIQDKVRNDNHLALDDLIAYISKNPRKMPCVAEVMSCPQVVTEAVKLGCGNGGSYDIQNGWDLL